MVLMAHACHAIKILGLTKGYYHLFMGKTGLYFEEQERETSS